MEGAGNIAVSVIIPVYNAERHLEECLDSCLGQTLKNIELICINDGSTDSTAEILERYAGRHGNMCILEQENQGAGVARNLGMKHARGEFIAFMDSDDYYPDKEVLQKLYTAAVREKVLVCGGSAAYLKRNEQPLCFNENGRMYYKEYQSWSGFTRFIYNRMFLQNSELTFPSYRNNEDPPFFTRTMMTAQMFYVISDCVYIIRSTDKIVRYDVPAVLLDILDGYKDILKIAQENRFGKLQGNVAISLKECLPYAYKAIYKGNEEVRKRFEQLLSEIDEELLAMDERKIVKPELISDAQICQIIQKALEKENMLMDVLKSYKRVLIYGAGRAGRLLHDCIVKRGFAGKVEFMVSSSKPNGTACGKAIKSISWCERYRDDAIVLIANKTDADRMEETAYKHQFKNVYKVSYEELQFFGIDMRDEKYLTIF